MAVIEKEMIYPSTTTDVAELRGALGADANYFVGMSARHILSDALLTGRASKHSTIGSLALEFGDTLENETMFETDNGFKQAEAAIQNRIML